MKARRRAAGDRSAHAPVTVYDAETIEDARRHGRRTTFATVGIRVSTVSHTGGGSGIRAYDPALSIGKAIEQALDPSTASGKCISLAEMSPEKRAEMERLYGAVTPARRPREPGEWPSARGYIKIAEMEDDHLLRVLGMRSRMRGDVYAEARAEVLAEARKRGLIAAEESAAGAEQRPCETKETGADSAAGEGRSGEGRALG